MISQNKELILGLFVLGAIVLTFYKPYVGYILYVIFIFLRPQDDRPLVGTYHIPQLLAVLVILSYVVHSFVGGKKQVFPKEKTFYLFLAFFVWMLVSSMFAVHEAVAWFSVNNFLFIVVLVYLTIQMVDTEKKLKILLLVLLFCGFVLSYEMQFSGSHMMESIGGAQFYRQNILRLNVNFGQPNYLAFTMVVMFCIALTMAIYSERMLLKLIFLSLCPIYIYTLMQTASRGGTLSFLSVLVVFWLSAKRKVVSLIIFAALAITLIPIAHEYVPNYFNRLETIWNYKEDVSAYGRPELWKLGIEFIKERPLFGIGLGNFEYLAPNSAHNSYIQIASELGIVGFLIWMVFLFTGWMNLFLLKRGMEKRGFIFYASMGIEIGLIAYFVQSLTSGIGHRELVYFLIAISIAIKNISHCLKPAD